VSVEQEAIERLRALPPDKQREVLAFMESLAAESQASSSPGGLRGLWADLNISITDEDIAQARRAMWGTFPRDLP
jgi:hypothetical protein